MNGYVIFVLILTLYKLIKWLYNNDNNIEESKLDESNNILKTDNIIQNIMIIKCEQYRIKYFKNKNTKMLFKNFLNDYECNHLCNIIRKYHIKQKQSNNNKQSKILDHILIKELINKNKNNKYILNELTIAYKKYIEITEKVIKLAQKKFNKNKLYLLTSDIICSYKGFYIPWHSDIHSELLLDDPENKDVYLIPPIYHVSNNGNQFNNSDLTPFPYNIKNVKERFSKNYQKLNIIPTNNLSHFKMDITCGKEYTYDNYVGGGGDKDAKIAIIIYLNTAEKDFTGGDLLIGMNNKITPKAGNITMFTGGPESYHMVEEISSGERISFLFWLTDNKNVRFKRNKIFNGQQPYSN
jgi:hypothetical protein